jgi:anti-sigma regulatory factor (Ser/Thr protein kinase)
MPKVDTQIVETRLTLRSRLADLTLVWPWVAALAAEYAIPADTLYAIDLCLEEAISNIVRHGYGDESNRTIDVDFLPDRENSLTFTVEDTAPPFAPAEPIEPQELPASLGDFKPGALGIHLMRKFAGSVTYEQLPAGNRLTLCFPVDTAKPGVLPIE